MRALLFLVLTLVASIAPLHAKLQRWDALPALDVSHLQGVYTSTSVCPMCRHGYDAGVLVLMPSSSAPDVLRRAAHRLRAVTERIDEARFRVFLVLVGDPPSLAVQDAVRHDHERWFVAQLSGSAIDASSSALGTSLAAQARGFVFAQRRMLWSFDPFASDEETTGLLPRYADYAMAFLRASYPRVPRHESDPDVPKGRLWLAPAALSDAVSLSVGDRSRSEAGPGGSPTRVCLASTAANPTNAGVEDRLVGVSLPASAFPERMWWARSDAVGCVRIAGAAAAGMLRLEIFTALEREREIELRSAAWRGGERVDVRLPDPPPGDSTIVAVTGVERIVGLPCEGCDGVFQGIQPNFLASAPLVVTPRNASSDDPIATTIGTSSEAGERLRLSGTVRDARGTPASDIVVYAYQTDARGIYPVDAQSSGAGARHGRLRGWARTDASGRYAFDTIRPGAYPDGSEPQHIHMHVIEPGRCTYYIGDVLFADDPRLDASARAEERQARAGSGVVTPMGDPARGWRATRDITLGLNVPGYDACR